MSDRQLLEAAARAGGYKPVRWTDDGTALLLEGVQEPWNALHPNPHSDCMGDALRLAVRLRMVVSLAYCTCCAVVDWADNEDENEVMVRFGEDFPDREAPDALAATRRAIVRAAALTQPEGGA